MTIDIYCSLLAIFYLFFISNKKKLRKIRLFLSKPLNILLILLLVIFLYNLNRNLGILLFILLLFSKNITNF